MPHKIDGAHVHGDKHDSQNPRGKKLSAQGNVLVEEIQRQKHQGEHTAIDHGQSFRPQGIVGRGKELGEKLEKVKLRNRAKVRRGKSKLAQAQGIHGGQQNNRRNGHRDGSAKHKPAEFPKESAESAHFLPAEIVVKEIEKAENSHHVADIVVGQEAKGQGDDKQSKLPFVHQAFDAPNNQRQGNETIQPHDVIGLRHHIGHGSVHEGKNQGGYSGRTLLIIEINGHGQSAGADLEQGHGQDGLGNHGIGKKQG